MSKEYLEAFNGLFDLIHCQDSFEKAQKYYDVIEQALNRLEAIDNVNPSEALECLDKIAKQIELDEDTDYWEIRNAHKTVENALIKAQKEEKVILGIEDYLNLRIKVEPLEDVRKAFIEIRNQLQVIKEVLE